MRNSHDEHTHEKGSKKMICIKCFKAGQESKPETDREICLVCHERKSFFCLTCAGTNKFIQPFLKQARKEGWKEALEEVQEFLFGQCGSVDFDEHNWKIWHRRANTTLRCSNCCLELEALAKKAGKE
jgi:hypothetical protein